MSRIALFVLRTALTAASIHLFPFALNAQSPSPGMVVTGKPYSGTATMVKTPPPGSASAPRSVSYLYYRDAYGRTRTEQSAGGADPWSGATPHASIRIVDPVAGVAYYLNPATQTAVKMNLRWDPPLPPSSHLTSASAPLTTTSLGSQTVLGFSCAATQTARTIGKGVIGNEEAITISTEQCYSADLGLMVQSSLSDPSRGTVNFGFQSLSTAGPDPSLFAPPANFTVKDARIDRANGREF